MKMFNEARNKARRTGLIPYDTNQDVETKTKAFLDVVAKGDTPLETMEIADARKVFVDTQASVDYEFPDTDVTAHHIEVGGRKVNFQLVKPKTTGDALLPVFIYVHGGGWVLGGWPTYERIVQDLVRESGAAAVHVDYTPSPEAKLGVPLEEVYAVTKHIAHDGQQYGLDPARLSIVGDSAGGNMGTVVAILAKQRKLEPALRHQLLLCPVTDMTDGGFDEGSMNSFQDGYFLTRPLFRWFRDAYTTNEKEQASMLASPVNASQEDLQGLPPAMIVTAQLDVLRDQGERYGRALEKAGVPVTTIRFNGMIHDWAMLNPLSEIDGAKSFARLAGSEIRSHLRDDTLSY